MEPYYQDEAVTLYHGDWREFAGDLQGDAIIADPPYGRTSLWWDRWPDGWPSDAAPLAPTMWCFGSLRMFWDRRDDFADWKVAQDVVWEKHNGSNFHADRFRRVHEYAVQFYRGWWEDAYKQPQYTMDAVKRAVRRRKRRPPHMGEIDGGHYQSEDGGPRLMRSVIRARSCHGRAQNETQKPEAIVRPLVEYSCPPDGTVLALFAGSGTTPAVARATGRACIAFDVREDQCEIAAERLSQGVLALEAEQ